MPEKSGVRRVIAAWGQLRSEQRLVIAASGLLLLTMFLPWYSRSVDAVVKGQLSTASDTKLAITVFSFVEAAIFLVAVGVTLLMLARGDKRAFHLPGGDGLIVTLAGAWATFLIFFRFVDKPGGKEGGPVALRVEYGLSWGIFFGLLAALALLAAGLRLRAARIAEPAMPGDVAPSEDDPPAPLAKRVRREPRAPKAADEQTRAERRREREERRRAAAGLPAAPRPTADTPIRERREAPTRHVAPSQARTELTRGEEPTRHARPEDAPTTHQDPNPPDAPPKPARRDSFEPPEFELPPPRRRDQP